MSDLALPMEVRVPADELQSIFSLYDRGLYLQAYRRAEQSGPLDHWRGTAGRLLAGRIAGNLGSPRLANWHFIHAFRSDRTHPEALWFFARYLLEARGPLAAWQFVQERSFPADAPRELRSHWHSLHAAILGLLRDFDAAENWLRQAEEIGAEPWTCLEWAVLYTLQDRHDDAEQAARRALQLRPWYRPAVQWAAHFLVQRERDDEALQLLTEATQKLESAAVFAQLAILQIELKQFADADRSLHDFERLSPLLDKEQKNWLNARRCDLACHLGDYDKATDFAKLVTGKFYEALAQRLANRTAPNTRVELGVGYVRQHHRTCAPATLTSIAKFWSMPADHVEVAEEIAYLGTFHHQERNWANDHGWFTKSFTVTWDAAVALLDRGIPFTLATTDVSSSHLQAVIGYDATRGTLILRDPNERHRVEIGFDLLMQSCRSTGPRGMALVPIADKAKLEALALPDEALCDLVHRFDLALDAHRREEAGLLMRKIRTEYVGHFLTLYAKRVLAGYDGDLPEALKITEELLKRFPGDTRLELDRASYLSVLGRRTERLDLLKSLAEQKDADPASWLAFAVEQMADAGKDAETRYLLRKALRKTPARSPLQGRLVNALARLRWLERRYDDAVKLHRIAVCLEERDENLARDYFHAANWRGEAERALGFLRERFQRFGAKSNQPARTLHSAYMSLNRTGEAFDVLDEAIRLRPSDGELLTYAADMHTYRAEFDRADAVLEKAQGISKPTARLRSLAYLATSRGERRKARDLWEQVLKIEPVAEDAHRNYVQFLAEEEERSVAIKHLRAVCERFPNHFGLARLHYDWLFPDGPAARAPILQKLIEIHPAHPWPRVEYAYNLADQQRFDEAHRQLDDAEPLDPENTNLWLARGLHYKRTQRIEDAAHAIREAIRCWVDFPQAIRELLALCENLQDRREALAFVLREVMRQPASGAALNEVHVVIQMQFPPQELLASLRRIHEARPDLLEAWGSLAQQTGYCSLFQDRVERAQAAAQAFPLAALMWINLAEAHYGVKHQEAERAALERAVELAPTYDLAVRKLAEYWERHDDIPQAKKVVQRAIRHMPLSPILYVEYADLLYRVGEREPAVAQLKHALELDPWHAPAWNRLTMWLNQLDRMEEAIDLATEWTKQRPGDARSWLALGQALHWRQPLPSVSAENDRVNRCVAAYDQALKRDPLASHIADVKAELLALAGRYEEARAACDPPAWKGKPPLELRGRAAWVTATAGDYDAARRQMQAVLKDDRAYNWGWDRLVEWSYATQEFGEFLEAATAWLRVRPQSALALTYRGEARTRMDERDIGLDDLANAQRKDPCLAFTAYTLFDEQMADENYAGAEATLLSMQENIAGDQVKARQIYFHTKRDNQAIALEIFRSICTNPFLDTLAVNYAMRSFDLANWKEPAERIVCEAMNEPKFPLHLVVVYAERWNPNLANDLPERIAAIDRALARQPDSLQFLSMKINLLISGSQFERAWQVCQTPVLPIDKLEMEGRAAAVVYSSGKRDDGIAMMKKLVQQNPKFFFGWEQLATWYGQMQNYSEVLSVAEQLVQLAPRAPIGYAQRGFAKFNLGDTQAAKADYIHSLDLAPNYVYSAWELFNMYLRAADWRKAESILEKAKKHADKAEWARAKVDLLVAQNKKGPFAEEFEKLLRNSAKSPWQVDYSLNYLVQAGWWGDAEEVMQKCLDLGPHICDPWVRLRVAMGDRRVGADIQNMSSRRAERTNCVAAYAVQLAYANDGQAMHDWVYRNEDALRADTVCWGKVGYAFYVVQRWQDLLDWMYDWADHAKATPAQLIPLVKGLRSLGQIDEARAVSEHALEKLVPDYTNSYHKVWLMFDQALDGEMGPVQRYLDTSDLGGFDGYHHLIASLVRALWLTAANPETGFKQGREILANSAKFAQPTVHDPALKNAYQKGIGEIANRRGSLVAKLWRFWRWLYPTLPQAPKPAPAQ